MMNEKEQVRIMQLMDYVKLLERLQSSGFLCNSELKETMEELHGLVMPKKEQINIVILERDAHVRDTVQLYFSIIENAKLREDYDFKNIEERKQTGHYTVRGKNIAVYIVDEDFPVSEYFLPDAKSVNHIINNTNDYDLPRKLGLKTI